jgi:two-component system, OmpR family, sensor histidine kinase QseC
MRSMRTRLLLALVAVVVVLSSGWLLCAAWLTLRANILQTDDALRSSAELILWYLPDQVDTAYRLPSTRGNPMPAQVWVDRRLVSRTPDAPATPMKSGFADGFSNVWVDHRQLRVYAASREDGRLQVQVGRSLGQWEADIWRAVAFGAANVLGLLLLVGTTVWWVTRWSFRPVTAIGAALRQRPELDLSALPTSALPDEIRPLVVSFNELLDRLRRSVEAERRFIADAAHELRTPLAALSAQAHVALQAIDANEREEALQRLAAGVNRCSRLTGQLLELARLDAAAGNGQHEAVDLSKLVEIVLRDFEGAARQKDQRLSAHLEPCLIRGDIDEIGILVRNLVDNALRFTAAGGRVAVVCGIVQFEGLSHAGLSVADNGPGVHGQERAQVFERFYRVAGTGQSGSGIGLSLVKRIAERHGAQITMTNGLDGRGVCMSVRFERCDSTG